MFSNFGATSLSVGIVKCLLSLNKVTFIVIKIFGFG